MALRIAIASGKGGTGKTTVAANLYHYFCHHYSDKVLLVDCDVEEPNAALFFPEAEITDTSVINQEIPVIDGSRCTFCRKCVEYCEFNAILVMPPVKFAEINGNLCHSCGACSVACEFDSIWVKDERIGNMSTYRTKIGDGILEGTLKIGSVMQTMVIRSLKRAVKPHHDIVIFDAPPGTSCPVVETISDTDYVILVTEPTPFGLHDLKLMVALVKELGIPFGVIVNKANLGTRDVYGYLESEDIELLGEIPFSRSYASLYANGRIFENVPGEIEAAYRIVMENLSGKIVLT